MRTFLLVILLAAAIDGKASAALYSLLPSTSYKSMLEMLLRQLSDIEKKNYPAGDTSAQVADQYQREFYTQAASDIVQKLIQYGALSAIVDAEEAAFYDDIEGEESKEADAGKVEEPAAVHIDVKVVEAAPSTADSGEYLTDEQAHEILKLIIDELMNKFFADYMKNGENSRVYVIGAGDSQQEENDEETDHTEESAGAEEEEDEEGDSSSSSSSSEEDYFYRDSDEYVNVEVDEDDDAVLVVNKQVSTNIIRIPAATFVDALTKLLPALKSDKYPAHLQKLTPLQVEDTRVYSEHGEPSLIGPKAPEPTRVSAHSVAPIASVAPTAASAAAPATTKETEYYHRAFDLGHVLLCLAAGLLSMWAIAQLVSMYRRRSQSAGPAPSMALPPKVIPAIIPNIYATPPAVLTKTNDAEKPPVYVENPTFSKPEDKPAV
ncbi:hypothetical protein PRIPAC_91168 [Pristionchus pacificus]|uniref:Uncharacterized protein n=1 Tax=Pristionchus pacificus TaxID=54126 RepID=A0A2A6CWD4_PRIPA|nr:hypothetical protein PRIPAC_91168 [Pristionchus pacificus]|eukprot:PDM82438.1 hypothetical protein PRIPAC_36831 [Pristionchus pacificus]